MNKISFTCDEVSENAKRLILEVLESGQFSPGPKVRQFEEELAKRHGAKHAVFVNSGTDALRLSLLALKEKYAWPDGSEVAVPALTFVATVNVVIQAGLQPLFVDVGMNDWTMNPSNLEHRLTCSPDGLKNLKAVMPVQLFGQECDPHLYELCKKNDWKILEDSCETILNPLRGEVGCHSTYMAHHLVTGCGGFALTNDDWLNGVIRSYANHGRDPWYIPGYTQRPIEKFILKRRFKFDRIGYSCRPTEFEAALGLAQLAKRKNYYADGKKFVWEDPLECSLYKRKCVAGALIGALKEFEELELPSTTLPQFSTYMMFPMLLKQGDKYDLCLHLEKNGIETRDMMPITNQPCFKKFFPEGYSGFSVAKEANEKGFYVPVHQGMTKDDVAWIGQTFEKYFAKQTGRLDKVANAL